MLSCAGRRVRLAAGVCMPRRLAWTGACCRRVECTPPHACCLRALPHSSLPSPHPTRPLLPACASSLRIRCAHRVRTRRCISLRSRSTSTCARLYKIHTVHTVYMQHVHLATTLSACAHSACASYTAAPPLAAALASQVPATRAAHRPHTRGAPGAWSAPLAATLAHAVLRTFPPQGAWSAPLVSCGDTFPPQLAKIV